MELTEDLITIDQDIFLATTMFSSNCSTPHGVNSTPSLSSTSCCDMSPDSLRISQWFTFWVEGVLIVVVGLFGLFGNTLSINILWGKDMRNAFNCLLIVLAAVDSFLIVLAMFDYSFVRAFGLTFDLYTYMFPYFLYPATNVVLCMSIFMVVAIAFERFLAVCRPYEYRAMSTTQSVTKRVLKLSGPVFVIAFLINIPKFFETKLKETMNNDTQTLQVSYVVTRLRKNPIYINYYVNWFRLLGTGVLPMLALIYLNINIYLKIVETRKTREVQRQTMGGPRRTSIGGSSAGYNPTHGPDENSNSEPNMRRKQEAVSKREIKMASILLTIVFVFFGCHLPRVLLNLHEFFMATQIEDCGDMFCPPAWFLCSISVNHFLLVVNSSVNILVYCSQGEKFRQGLTEKLHLQQLSKWFLFSKPRLNNSSNDDLTLKVLAPNGPARQTLIPRPEVSSQYLMIPTQKHSYTLKEGSNTH
ncbi:hypothetical protein TCAL_05014 [Tigriopus californicus]|uniref:G-protein coupled receptors family 1 profile domain-containing protein n=2 Tax=Tigriopus californicus TaxID=6832 RepID=A0A553PKU9_TIGCA|nr:hypothetical protein TCAL_05014 [Tigriopus californicus]